MKRPWLTFWIGLGLCLAGVAYALWVSKDAADAGRDGALAVALSFLILFQNHGSAKTAFDDTETDQLPRIHNALAALIDASGNQRWPLTATSVCGTLFWGFADILARWLCHGCS